MKDKFYSTFQGFCVAACVLLMLVACKLPDSNNTPTTWAVTVQYDEDCGTASANPNPAEKGKMVIITAEPKSRYKFKAWKLVSGNVVLYSINTNPAAFTMPGNDVIIMAEFEILADITLDEVTYGYEQPAKKSITVTDLGVDAQTVQNIELSAGDESPFVLDEQDLQNKITLGNVLDFLAQPKAGLKSGTYTDTVIVTHGSGKKAIFYMGITVNPKPVVISGLTAGSREYDGTTAVTLIGTAIMSGIIDGDDVKLNNGEAVFEDKNAGNGKEIIFSGFTLSGADAENYTLPQQSGIKADILPKPITIGYQNPSRTLVPFAATVDIYVVVNGQIAGETVSVSVGTNIYGLSGSVNTNDNDNGILPIVYDGTPVEQTASVSVDLDIGDNNYTFAPNYVRTIKVSIRDGLAPDHWIPITNANLKDFQVYVNTADGLKRHYKLIEDITLNTPPEGGTNWTAIGSRGVNAMPFTGSFDGGGKVINNLANSQGMFATIGTGGVVINIALVGGSISGTDTVGGLAGLNSGTIQNCYTTANVRGSSFVGGLVGMNSNGTIQNCYTTGNINSNGEAGGVVGMNNGTVKNCFAMGKISGWNQVGGVAGSVLGGNGKELRNCVALNLLIISIYNGSNTLNTSRVVGRSLDEFYNSISNNYARSDMDVKYNWNGSTGDNKTIVSDHTSADGLSITSTQYNSASWWTTAGNWSGGAWDFANTWQMNANNLPKLQNVGGSQEHSLADT
jgi:hypothetical protein